MSYEYGYGSGYVSAKRKTRRTVPDKLIPGHFVRKKGKKFNIFYEINHDNTLTRVARNKVKPYLFYGNSNLLKIKKKKIPKMPKRKTKRKTKRKPTRQLLTFAKQKAMLRLLNQQAKKREASLSSIEKAMRAEARKLRGIV